MRRVLTFIQSSPLRIFISGDQIAFSLNKTQEKAIIALFFMSRPVVVNRFFHLFTKQHDAEQVWQGHYHDSHS